MKPDILKDFRKKRFSKNWWGKYSYLISSYSFDGSCKTSKKMFGVGMASKLLSHKKGVMTCYLEDSELNKYGEFLARRVIKNQDLLTRWSNDLKKESDNIRDIIRKGRSLKTFVKLDNHIILFNSLQIANKALANHFSVQEKKRFLPILEDARKYSETVFAEIEGFVEKLAEEISKKERINRKYIKSLLREEMLEYLKSGKLPSSNDLKQRYNRSGIYFLEGKRYFLSGDIENAENIISQKYYSKIIKGTIAFSGKACGKCRIILNPEKRISFDKGDILITPMTTPDFVPIMEKASAFVTDVGGLLCHAAIVARELKKPCIIGTRIATKVFKDGDIVEVDANKGIVKKIK